MSASKAADLIRGQLSQRALIKLKDDGNIGLYNLANENEHLKKNDTTLYSFESLVDDIVTEFDLAKKSTGTERKPLPTGNEPTDKPNGATGLAAKLAAVTAS